MVGLSPEEWVRQHCIQFLLKIKNVPWVLYRWKKLKINNTEKRYDLVVFNPDSIAVLVECKAPTVNLTQKTFVKLRDTILY